MFALRNSLRSKSSYFKACSSVTRCFRMEVIPILYGTDISPPVRFVLETASLLGIDLEYRKIDLFKNEHKSEFYTKINPLQKVPALIVNDEVIRDSHAIALFLCRQKKDQDLYPKDEIIRTRVDDMLFFNSFALFPTDADIYGDFFAGKWPTKNEKVERWNSLLDYLEHRLCENLWLAGEKMTLCDLCCAETISSLRLLVPALDRHVKINQWFGRLKNLPCFKINSKGTKDLKDIIEATQKTFQ